MDYSEHEKRNIMLFTKRCHYSSGRVTCIELLQSGHLDAFNELFQLILKSRDMKREAEHRGERHVPKLLEKNENYLKFLSSALTDAERARNLGRITTEYENRMKLGNHFNEIEDDFWIAEHFYRSCYDVVKKAGVQDGRRIIRALERLGYINERKGAINDALGLLDQAFKYAEDNNVVMGEKVRHALDLITHRICMTLGQRSIDSTPDDRFVESEPSVQEALKLFEKAYENARSAEATENQAAAQAKIGKVMNRLGNYDQASKHFSEALKFCKRAGDVTGTCHGYIALASVHENMGNLELALSTLSHCRAIGIEQGLPEVLMPCCLAMGRVLSSLSDFEAAAAEYEKAFEILGQCRERFENYEDLNKYVRVLCGVGKAHLHYRQFIQTVLDTSPYSLAKLFEWQSNGLDF